MDASKWKSTRSPNENKCKFTPHVLKWLELLFGTNGKSVTVIKSTLWPAGKRELTWRRQTTHVDTNSNLCADALWNTKAVNQLNFSRRLSTQHSVCHKGHCSSPTSYWPVMWNARSQHPQWPWTWHSSIDVSTPLKSLLSAENESCAPFSNNKSKTYEVMRMSRLIKVLHTYVTFATQKASAAQINAVKLVSFFSHNSHHYKPRENWIVFLASRFPRYAWVPTHLKWGAPTSRLHFRALCAITSPTLNRECGL